MSTGTRTFRGTAVLLDLDGVLIDSTRCVERHWRQWAVRHGLDADVILLEAHGVRNVDTMRRIAPHLDVEKEAAEFAAHEVEDTEGVVPVDGARHILASLEGAPWAVVTSCGAALAQARLRAAGLTPQATLITGSDVTRGKPEPEPYLLAASRLGVRPAECIVVEDAPAGIEAGKRAGMQVIAIAFTYPADRLRSGPADLVLYSLGELTVQKAESGSILIRAPAL